MPHYATGKDCLERVLHLLCLHRHCYTELSLSPKNCVKARNDIDCTAHGWKLFISFYSSIVEPSSKPKYSLDEQEKENSVVQKKSYATDSQESLTNSQKKKSKAAKKF